MANLLIYDLTSDSEYGTDLGRAIQELARYRDVKFQPEPGELNSQMRQRAMDLVQRYYNPSRKQVRADLFLDHFARRLQDRINSGESTYAEIVNYQRVFLLDQDIHTSETNWVFGFFQQRGPHLRVLISSKARITSSQHAFDHLIHELGHMFGAPSDGRSNTNQHLGLHCSNPLCVMQQKDTVASAKAYVEARSKANAPVFCSQCSVDLIISGIREGSPLPEETLNKLLGK